MKIPMLVRQHLYTEVANLSSHISAYPIMHSFVVLCIAVVILSLLCGLISCICAQSIMQDTQVLVFHGKFFNYLCILSIVKLLQLYLSFSLNKFSTTRFKWCLACYLDWKVTWKVMFSAAVQHDVSKTQRACKVYLWFLHKFPWLSS